jgi:carbonic anhydrase/acetyltransferase-like protein (isoleucine patch superfamily)
VSDRTRDWPARLEIDPTAFIAPGAVVVGEVRIGARASVWFNTVIRGDTDAIEVGEDTNVQDLATLHVDEGMPARIGARVTVGHAAIVHGCVVEDDCLIGMGSIVLSGARVGAGSLLGAGTLIREGQVVPPGSLVVGAPGRVTGPVAEHHRAAIRHGAEHYVALSRSYLERGIGAAHSTSERRAGRSATDRGPMSHFEWHQLLQTLAEAPTSILSRWPADLEGWKREPGPGRWSPLEVVCHLADADRDVYLPRLDRLLGELMPWIQDVDMNGWDRERDYRARKPRPVIEAWSADRARLVARLAPLGPAEWERGAIHSRRGPFTIAHMVRGFVEHDLSHRRQIALAFGELP